MGFQRASAGSASQPKLQPAAVRLAASSTLVRETKAQQVDPRVKCPSKTRGRPQVAHLGDEVSWPAEGHQIC